jgi:hypothetical protein
MVTNKCFTTTDTRPLAAPVQMPKTGGNCPFLSVFRVRIFRPKKGERQNRTNHRTQERRTPLIGNVKKQLLWKGKTDKIPDTIGTDNPFRNNPMQGFAIDALREALGRILSASTGAGRVRVGYDAHVIGEVRYYSVDEAARR